MCTQLPARFKDESSRLNTTCSSPLDGPAPEMQCVYVYHLPTLMKTDARIALADRDVNENVFLRSRRGIPTRGGR